MTKDSLVAEYIIRTVGDLYLRITDRFPTSGLSKVAEALRVKANETDRTIRWIETPILAYRIIVICIIFLVLGLMFYTGTHLKLSYSEMELPDFIQVGEAGLNMLVILGAAIIFLVSIENRTKRKRIINSINKLRSIAHVIDAHQLTKDPHAMSQQEQRTQHSPKREMTEYELARYLDYCSELLSLTSKIGFLYVQNFSDPISVDAVNDLESLTSGLSRKIWQKIMLINPKSTDLLEGKKEEFNEIHKNLK